MAVHGGRPHHVGQFSSVLLWKQPILGTIATSLPVYLIFFIFLHFIFLFTFCDKILLGLLDLKQNN